MPHWRSSESTMMIRVKLVIMIRMAGANERTVSTITNCMAAENVVATLQGRRPLNILNPEVLKG